MAAVQQQQKRCNDVPPSLPPQDNNVDMDSLDELSRRLRQEALDALADEPELTMLLHNTVLAPGVRTFEDAVACAITYRILLRPCHSHMAPSLEQGESSFRDLGGGDAMFCPSSLRGIIADALHSSTITEAGHTMAEAVRLDALAVCERDPAVDTLLEVVLFMKGFAALVCHRAAYYKWQTRKSRIRKKSVTSLWLQSQASAVFGVDIHPAATMGAGIMLDHATGIVVGETATVGDGCTLLHGVTLGGTGKDSGDRHPKVGKYVLIGANASLLGNISIGDGAKIGAGSVVLRNIPSGSTAVGAPAKIIGRAKEARPGSTMDETLHQVAHLSRAPSTNNNQQQHQHNQHHAAKGGGDEMMMGSDGTASTFPESNSSSEEYSSASDNEYLEYDSSKDNNNNNSKDGKQRDHKGGTTKSSGNSNKQKTDPCCPYRDYIRMSQKAPKGTVTFCNLRRFLAPEGCCVDTVGEVLFELDTHTKGYIKPDKFFSPATMQVLIEKTKLEPERVQKLMDAWQDQLRRECEMLHQLETQTEDIRRQSQKHSVSSFQNLADAVTAT